MSVWVGTTYLSVGEQYLPQTEGLQVFLGSGANPARIQIPHFGSTPFGGRRLTLLTVATACQTSSGVVFNTGGPVWGLDWCPHPESTTGIQHLAVSTAYNDLPIGSCGPSDARGAIQVWSVNAEGTLARCELVLCVQGGAALDLKWMPLGGWDGDGGSRKLGILAVVQEDGSVSFYSVPKPPPSSDQPVYSMSTPTLLTSSPRAMPPETLHPRRVSYMHRLAVGFPHHRRPVEWWVAGHEITDTRLHGYLGRGMPCRGKLSSSPPLPLLPSNYFTTPFNRCWEVPPHRGRRRVRLLWGRRLQRVFQLGRHIWDGGSAGSQLCDGAKPRETSVGYRQT